MWAHRTGPQIWAYVVIAAPSRKGMARHRREDRRDRFGNSEPVRNVVRQFSWPVPPNAADFHLGPSSVPGAYRCVLAAGKYTLFHPP
ncbi:unnamed protein product [Lasius platythorax]|uniref:Uncharacterized protein n=1 Tax=Lasius platythorax TaxID=488582 RepID=A0AAV2NCA7_9HYME